VRPQAVPAVAQLRQPLQLVVQRCRIELGVLVQLRCGGGRVDFGQECPLRAFLLQPFHQRFEVVAGWGIE